MKKLFYLFLIVMVGLSACGYKLPEENRDEYVIRVAKEGSPEEMKKILKNYPEYKEKKLNKYWYTVLHFAAEEGSPEMIQAMYESGMDINICRDVVFYNTPLERAYFADNYETMNKLLECGADPYVITPNIGESIASRIKTDPDLYQDVYQLSDKTHKRMLEAISEAKDGSSK